MPRKKQFIKTDLNDRVGISLKGSRILPVECVQAGLKGQGYIPYQRKFNLILNISERA